MEFESINPYNGETIGIYKACSDQELRAMLTKSHKAFSHWKNVAVADRAKLMAAAAGVLRRNVDQYARMITLEMGKPIKESRGEINKCAWGCEYYAEHGPAFLDREVIATDATESFVRHDPMGCILSIMPWNFPFWQAFRFAAPAIMAGNTALLKHAPNVFGCAEMIASVFLEAGIPEGVFQNVIVHHDRTADIIADPVVKAVTLTGSERAGAAVAELAGRNLKKCVLELGGSNAFIVLADADIELAVQIAVTARMQNAGQSCIAAKRFIVVGDRYNSFVEAFAAAASKLKAGDPLDEDTQIGPLARRDLADQLQQQVVSSVSLGAKVLLGGQQRDCFHEPTVLDGVTTDMPAFTEETFGPLAPMIKAMSDDEAFLLSEQSRYGLGVTVCTQDVERAKAMAGRVSDGAFFVNELVKSDPRLPFGGTKRSGYGRELARDGMMEFVNRKTVYLK
jgi:succinate-semialdehyde dehydrogenase/glutarate-semialdehyde dehydrogenase